MLGFSKVYNINRLWITYFAHVLTQVFMGITNTIVSPGTALKSTVSQISVAFNASTSRVLDGAKGALKRLFISGGVALVTVWVSVALYVAFYHFYVPAASLVRPAHFQFRVCSDGSGICSFPTANITLCAPNCAEVLGTGQQYRVILKLLLPDSALNRDAGMFMVHGRMYDQAGSTIQESSRAVAVKYQSDILKLIRTIALAPLYFTDFAEESQILDIELFDDFRDDYYQPTVGVLLEIQSHMLTFYSAQLQFHACYAGLKYYLFYYPVSSALCGVTFNCVWLMTVFLLTWCRGGTSLLEFWLTKIGVFMQGKDDYEESEENHDFSNGECLREWEEDVKTVKSYIQPFTVTTSSKVTESAESIGGSTTGLPTIPETPSPQQEKSPSDRPCLVQPFTVGVAVTQEAEKREDENTEAKKVLKATENYSENGEALRPPFHILQSCPTINTQRHQTWPGPAQQSSRKNWRDRQGHYDRLQTLLSRAD